MDVLDVMKGIVRLWEDEDGATAVEYALVAISIAAVVITAVHFLGAKVSNSFTGVANKMP